MPTKPRFTVDTHLFRELGTQLVGRASTALVELIKNAYDADAGEVHVHGEALEDGKRGIIRIHDTGTGMLLKQFEEGYLRIASRGKEASGRYSPVFRRRYTGAKGIGRLAARKLAELQEITSIAGDGKGRRHRLSARIDWDAIERKDTLDELGDEEMSVTASPLTEKDRTAPGTEILLRQLRQQWTPGELKRFLWELQSCEPFQLLTRPLYGKDGGHRILDEPLLFEEPRVRDTSKKDSFRVSLTGALEEPEGYWELFANAVEWVIEVEASVQDKTVQYGIAPSRTHRMHCPQAEKKIFTGPHPNLGSGLSFQARLLLRKRGWTLMEKARDWLEPRTGIRVFMEGFRVLPYGEERNDWLSIDADNTRRNKGQELLGGELLDAEERALEQHKRLGLSGSPNAMFMGAVFLTEARAPSLKMLINREGFAPDPAFAALELILRTANHLFIRRRALAKYLAKESAKPPEGDPRERSPASPEPSGPGGPRGGLSATQPGLSTHSGSTSAPSKASARDSAPGPDVPAMVEQVRSMEAKLDRILQEVRLEKKLRQDLVGLRRSLAEHRQDLERHAAR
jgi:hypothetical protein